MEQNIDILSYSEYLVNHFNYYQEPITNKKLQKLLYYMQGWHLAYFDSQLFNETPEAWVHGPVYPSVYNKFKKFKFNPISTENDSLSLNSLTSDILAFNFLKDQHEFFNNVINHYGGKSAFELEMRSHNELPWLEARKGLNDIDVSQRPINIDTMRNYFKSRLPKS